ncbi:antigen 5 like allergen Cul n 1-like [Stomoxys calcitrans]|uniref:antigen 5 like allergen Cul n 1-like n=1 Tax=Stomoxys calcitrans TaxID=35570 RepID=UPI0027E39234|nr:antigen 5 like allergen Cul n 1-like [Stomoxys calcitrans]
MNLLQLILFTVLCISGYVTATNYCSSTICSGGKTHIACGHNGRFDATCPANAAMINFNATFRANIVNRHNTKRNLIAGGTVANHKAACRMASMQWTAELAKLAALNVRQCIMNHDACRNTDDFKYSGQNLARIPFWGKVNTRKMLFTAIDLWYSEVKNSKMSNINKFPATYDHTKEIGHFTVMVAERNIRVGCAAATYKKQGDTSKTFLMACNYATTNMIDRPIYASCARPAAKCKKGKNVKFPNLCKVAEVYDVNTW